MMPRARPIKILHCSARCAALAAILSVWAAGGCAGRQLYRPKDLPAEFCAPPAVNVHTLDLTHLAGPPVSKEVIEAGDVIEITICAGLNADDVTRLPVRVSEDGMALLPEIGPVPLAGLNLTAAEQAIGTICTQRGFYRQPQVTVTMRDQRVNRITVVGAVKEPGIKELPHGSSYILAALVAAGGLSADAGPRVEIRTPTGNSAMAHQTPEGVQLASALEPVGPESVAYVCLNLAESVRQGGGSRYLPDGTVITVERREPQPYHVIGLVQRPGQYDFPVNHELRVLGAIAQAGGVTQGLVADKVHIIRPNPDGSDDVTIELSLRAAKRDRQQNLRLKPGDVVSVEDTPATVLLDAVRRVPFTFGASLPIF